MLQLVLVTLQLVLVTLQLVLVMRWLMLVMLWLMLVMPGALLLLSPVDGPALQRTLIRMRPSPTMHSRVSRILTARRSR
jgi:hypothetical protein